MADNEGRLRKPRIRRTAPTIRQKIEDAQLQAEKQSQSQPEPKFKKPSVLKGKQLPTNRALSKLLGALALVGHALKWLTPRYLVNSWHELRKVQWPARKETWRLTLAVFIFAIVFGALVAGVDKGLDEIFKKLVLK